MRFFCWKCVPWNPKGNISKDIPTKFRTTRWWKSRDQTSSPRILGGHLTFERVMNKHPKNCPAELPGTKSIHVYRLGDGFTFDSRSLLWIIWVWLDLPSRKLTYPPKNGILKMIFLFPRWDMLIPWRVPLSHLRPSLRKMSCAQLVGSSRGRQGFWWKKTWKDYAGKWKINKHQVKWQQFVRFIWFGIL